MSEPTTDPNLAPVGTPVGVATMSSGLREATHFHDWTFEWIEPYVSGRVLDVGGGTANHLLRLTDRELVSVELGADEVAALRQRFAHVPRWSFVEGDFTDPGLVAELGPESFDTVLSCNVFEHIERDDLAFAHAAALLRPGGSLVLLLPAHQALYGSMDRLAGHHRRYDKSLARARLASAGLELAELRYVNVLGALGWWVNGRMPHRDLSSGSINAQIGLFDRYVVPVLRRLERGRSMPLGQSLLCVGRKPR
jgi:SAM-dependent methyltransferase